MLKHTMVAAAFAVFLPAVALNAADFPAKPIKLVAPYPPGGPIDVSARLVAERLEAKLGQPVVIDNRPGAGGTIGHEYVANQPPDGYTLLFTGSNIATYPVFFRSLRFDPVKSFAPIGL